MKNFIKKMINKFKNPNKPPKTGAFIGWKMCRQDALVMLFIPEYAKRVCCEYRGFTEYICRCNNAYVLDIINVQTGEKLQTATSIYDPNFFYVVGKSVKEENFDENKNHRFSKGIYFFMSKERATNHYA